MEPAAIAGSRCLQRAARIAAVCLCLGAGLELRADDKQVAEEIRLLREQNAALKKSMESQNGAIEALTQKIKQLEFVQSSRETAAGENAAPADTGFNLGKIHLGAEGGVGFFTTGNQGFAPNSEFRVDEARLLLDAPVMQDVYFFGTVDLATRENNGLSTQLGELYLDFEDVSRHLWGKDGQLNVRAGRFQIPFGEEYQHRYAMENPLITHSLTDFWGIDPGVELFGSLGKFSYAVAVQNGGVSGVQDFDGDKSVTGRIGFSPNKHWHFSLSGTRTGDIDAARDFASQLWLANSWFLSIGSPTTTKFHAELGQADISYRWKSGHVSAFGGIAHYADNDTAADNTRDLFYCSVEAQQKLTDKFFIAARFSEVFCDKGYPLVGLGNYGTFAFGPPVTELWRFSVGIGWRFSPNLIWKTEYALERGSGPAGSRQNEDFFGTEAVFKF